MEPLLVRDAQQDFDFFVKRLRWAHHRRYAPRWAVPVELLKMLAHPWRLYRPGLPTGGVGYNQPCCQRGRGMQRALVTPRPLNMHEEPLGFVVEAGVLYSPA